MISQVQGPAMNPATLNPSARQKDSGADHHPENAKTSPDSGSGPDPAQQEISREEQQAVLQLKQRDQQVKAHERAHMAAGAGLVQGGANYQYERGPDGRMYAVGGEVRIDTSAENDPDQTIRKMEQVKRAAMAPADPSSTDRAVAARASQIAMQARIEKTRQQQEAAEVQRRERQEQANGPDRFSYRLPEPDPVGKTVNVAV